MSCPAWRRARRSWSSRRRRRSRAAAPAVWSSSAAEYHVLGWAGRALIVAQQFEGESISLLAFDGPGSARPLAQNASLVAISPDGSAALVDESPAETDAPALRL